MKDRDRRKLYFILTLLASIAIAVGTGLTITFVALGILVVYVKNHFAEWNEKRKARIKAKKIEEEENKPSLLSKLKNKLKKSQEKNKDEEIYEEEYKEKCPQNYMNYNSSDFQLAPQFDINSNTPSGLKIPEYPSAAPKGRTYDDDLNTIAIIDNKRKRKRKKKIKI